MSYWVYMRVSTRTQAEKNSTENQKEGIYKYVADHGLTVAGEFSDEGISGAVDRTEDDDAIYRREGLIELLGTAEEGDTIIVQNTSRLWRSDTAKVLIRREIMKSKLKVISVENPKYDIYTKDPTEFLLNGFMELLDEYDKMAIAMKLARGRVARAKSGHKACGTAPIGYMWVENEIVIDPDTVGAVKGAFNAYEDTKSLARTSRILESNGFLSNRGNTFSRQSLYKILKNDFYIGIVTHAGKKVDGHHEAIIEKEQFDRVQEILHREDRRRPKKCQTAEQKGEMDN